jgi:hypothetical protein
MADKFAKFGGIFPIERADGTDGDATVAMTLKEFAEASYVVEQALKFFNYAPLLERLRSAATLLSVERSIAADIIEGKVKRPKHRPLAWADARSRKLYLAVSVAAVIAKGISRKAAVKDVAEANGRKISTISTAFRENQHLFPGLIFRRVRRARSARD